MERTEICELTILCLIRKGNYILLQDRLKPDWRGYTLPGGHVEPGESFVDAAIREMKEETGLTILNPQLCGVKQFPSNGHRYIVMLFRASEFEGELQSSPEGKMEWVPRDAISRYPTVSHLEELLEVMEQDNRNEFQYTADWEVLIH